MPYYHSLGDIPHKRHTVMGAPGGGIRYEHLMGNMGFSGIQSLLYTIRRPTTMLSTKLIADEPLIADPDRTLRMRHLRTHRLQTPGPSAAVDRIPLLFNNQVTISLARPGGTDEFFYRNGQADEIVFVTEGSGVLQSQFGQLPYRKGDYLVIPRGIVTRINPDDTEQIHLVMESTSYVRTPKRYRNAHGQLLEHSPLCERDIRPPSELVVHDEVGEFAIVVRKDRALHELVIDHHPFDTVGWDGYYFPWAFNIEDFEPITGRVHQPPPVHQTFEGDRWVLCSFVPRLYDYHPQAIPAPYNHSNVMSDEMLYYVSEEFMSRKGIEYGSITLHPDGLPHGPQPGKTEESIGKTETNELAVMVDTFDPLFVAQQALPSDDEHYGRSWIEK